MIDRHHALLYGRDMGEPKIPIAQMYATTRPALVPVTYTPDCRWRDLRVVEREEALRQAAVMAYPTRRVDWLTLAVWCGGALMGLGCAGVVAKAAAWLWGLR